MKAGFLKGSPAPASELSAAAGEDCGDDDDFAFSGSDDEVEFDSDEMDSDDGEDLVLGMRVEADDESLAAAARAGRLASLQPLGDDADQDGPPLATPEPEPEPLPRLASSEAALLLVDALTTVLESRPGKGEVLIAGAACAAGETILIERPLLVWSNPSSETLGNYAYAQSFIQAYLDANEPTKQQILAMYHSELESGHPLREAGSAKTALTTRFLQCVSLF
jgi:hypothetical protein